MKSIKINNKYKKTRNKYNSKKKIGFLSGNYKKGEINIDIKNIPIKKLPFTEKIKNIQGTVSLYGKMDSKKGTIYLTGQQIASKKLKGFDVFGKLYKQDYKWFADISTKDKKIDLNAFYETKRNNGIVVSYNGVDSNNVLQILGFKNPQLSGKVSGNIKYSANDYKTSVNMNFKKGKLLDNNFNSWNISADYSNKQISISTFTLTGPQANVQVKSFIDFSSKNSDSYFNTSVKNFRVKGINVNYNLTINGKLVDDNKVFGKISADKLEIGKINLAHKAFVSLSKEKIHLSRLNNDNGLSGDVEYDISENTISALIRTTQSKLSQYYSKTRGSLTSEVNVSGNIKNPVVLVDATIKDGFYNDLLFNAETKVVYKNKKMNLNKFTILAGDKDKAKITGSGILDKNNSNLQIQFKNVSETIINKYVGFRTPLKGVF